MRSVRLLCIAALSGGALLVPVASAGAVPAANKTCSSFKTLQKELDNADPTDARSFDADAFEKVGDAFHKAARTAPKSVKSAMNTLGDFYDALGGKDDAVAALQEFAKNGKKFTKAITKFSTYLATSCS